MNENDFTAHTGDMEVTFENGRWSAVMCPGPALDAAVGAALGLTGTAPMPRFSIEWHMAAVVLNYVRDQRGMWELHTTSRGVRCRMAVGTGASSCEGLDGPHAICLAFLAALENRVQRGCCGDE